MQVTVPHSLSREEARNRLQDFANRMRSRYPEASGLQENWNGDQGTLSGKIRGFDINAAIAVDDTAVSVRGDLPFPASLFESSIESAVRNGLLDALGERTVG